MKTLEDRLTELELRMPDTLVARALAGAAGSPPGRSRSRRPRWMTATLAVAVLAVALAGASYFAPRFAQALADAPVVGSALGPALRSVGLAALQGRFTALDNVATSSGYTVRLVAAYADSNQTVLVLKVEPPDRGLFRQPELTDQFGRVLELSGGMSDQQTGDNVMTFAGVPWPDAILGLRLRLHASVLEATEANSLLPGNWTVQGTIPVEASHSLPVPAAGTLGDSTFRFTSVEATSATVFIHMEVTGSLAGQLDRTVGETIPGVAKPHPAFSLELIDQAGAVTELGERSSSGIGPAQISATWVVVHAGDYGLRVSYEGVGSFERTITVR